MCIILHKQIKTLHDLCIKLDIQSPNYASRVRNKTSHPLHEHCLIGRVSNHSGRIIGDRSLTKLRNEGLFQRHA